MAQQKISLDEKTALKDATKDNMNILRTYPQPDSPMPHIGPRERALATYKYLLDMEPEQAINHKYFAVMVHAFEQAGWAALNDDPGASGHAEALYPSLCEQLTRTTSGTAQVQAYNQKPL